MALRFCPLPPPAGVAGIRPPPFVFDPRRIAGWLDEAAAALEALTE